MSTATQLIDLLALRSQPVAIKFQDLAPEGLPQIESAAPVGCAYWRLAAEGKTFFTEASDHYGCPIGSYTHGIDMPDDELYFAIAGAQLEAIVHNLVTPVHANRELEKFHRGRVA